jgi:hypothetical protein
MLTSNVQLHLELVQHHLQTLPGTTPTAQRMGVLPTFHKSFPSSKLLQA